MQKTASITITLDLEDAITSGGRSTIARQEAAINRQRGKRKLDGYGSICREEMGAAARRIACTVQT
jgi:hypothetical protein